MPDREIKIEPVSTPRVSRHLSPAIKNMPASTLAPSRPHYPHNILNTTDRAPKISMSPQPEPDLPFDPILLQPPSFLFNTPELANPFPDPGPVNWVRQEQFLEDVKAGVTPLIGKGGGVPDGLRSEGKREKWMDVYAHLQSEEWWSVEKKKTRKDKGWLKGKLDSEALKELMA